MNKIFCFGEKIAGFEMRVLNEREVRASAGILFLLAIISFLNAWLVGNYQLIKIFVVIFLVDFSLRIFVNPKYSPSLIIGRFAVRNQKVEYVGAPQKRFAWIIGFLLAVTMFFVVVINNVIGPLNLIICLTCLSFLFFEAAFGICIGCSVYNMLHREKAKLCPGNACAREQRAEIQKINFSQTLLTVAFLLLIFVVAKSPLINSDAAGLSSVAAAVATESESTDCVVPEWVKKIGHEEKWKLHHGCK